SFVMAIEENRMGAQTRGSAQRHCGLDAELASFVAGGGNDAALIRSATNDHGFPPKFGALEEFHGHEKGVHVHMEDGSVQGSIAHFGGIVFGAEAGEVRHAFTVRGKADSLAQQRSRIGEPRGYSRNRVGSTSIIRLSPRWLPVV